MKRFLFTALAALAASGGFAIAAYPFANCTISVSAASITAADSPRKFTAHETRTCTAGTDGCCFLEKVVISKWDGTSWNTISSTSQEVNAACGVTNLPHQLDYPIGSAGMYKCQLIVTNCTNGAILYGPVNLFHTFP